jgi:CHAT domain-containing protein/tetratricopeptide (TPR) repeat protein
MSANAKFGWCVSALVVSVTATLALTTYRADPPFPPRNQRSPRSPSKNFIVEFDAAQKAWMLAPTADTAWARADALDTLAGAEIAASAWDDYLQLDSTSSRAQEARVRRRQKVVTVTPNPALTTELDLTEWAKAVLGRSANDEKRALAVLTAQGKGQQLFTGDAFVADVAGWLTSLSNDRTSKVRAADAILLLQSGGTARAAGDLESAEDRLRRARNRLRQMRSPLATTGVLHFAGVLHSRGRSDRAAAVLLAHHEACTPERRYVTACGSQRWAEGLIDLQRGRASEALARFGQALDQFERSGDVARRAGVLFARAATLDSMRTTDEAWIDRIRAVQLMSPDTRSRDSALMMLAIAAARDGYHYAADQLFSQVKRSDAGLARWRTLTQSRIAGADPNLQLASLGIVRADGTFIRANASFTSNRRDVVTVSLEGSKGSSPPPRTDWSGPVDEFVPNHIQREALGVLMADTVRHLYENESRTEAENGSAEAALWLSDRARTVGVPVKEMRACISERESASAADMGKMLVACVPVRVTIVYQDLDETRLRTWVIRGGRVQLTTTWVSAPQLTADVARFRNAIKSKTDAASVRLQAQHLYDILFRPVQQQIAGSDLLVYSPSPNLRGVPVISLHDGTRFLLEARPVVTTLTLSAFELPQLPAKTASALVVLPEAAPSRNVLDGARGEVLTVARIYENRSKLLSEAAATPEKFLASALTYDIVHVATHGETGGARPYQNFIEFGQERLRAYDIFTLHLTRKPIVMLAACRTSDSSGGPLNVGLADAFLAAGASAVVGTLWDVEDRPTVHLSVGFHRELAKGATPHDALRTVQLQFIRQGMPVSAWAAFQVSS